MPPRRISPTPIPALKSFQNGLRASHVGAPSYNTVVGHSYGTTVIGDAAGHDQLHPDDPPSSRGPLNADNVVFVASPGSTVDHAGDLHLTGVPQDQVPQHVWSTRAKGDWIGIPARSGEILDAARTGPARRPFIRSTTRTAGSATMSPRPSTAAGSSPPIPVATATIGTPTTGNRARPCAIWVA
ncbi:alpha/beta hydrolase [Nocardia jiangxiensis]|uniref:Alpha/beta hydrolase n=1 Tax=Nocardia jiangxiensis TaxID=282685 RepID=A0ABW6S190_9NOCA